MIYPQSKRVTRAILYGGGSTLLALDIFFLIKASLTDNFVPIVPIIASIFTAAGLMFVVYAEQKAREEDKRDHRRIAKVAHQLTNPLTNLQDDLMALLKNSEKLPSSQRLQIKKMETKSKVLLDNIRDVFLALQATESSISEDVRVYDICSLVEEGYRRTKSLASAHNVEVIYQAHCSKATAKIDRRLFLIALTHILENAILYSKTPGFVNVAVTRGNKKIRIIVQDRGIGISKKDAPKVWRPFARGSKSEQYDPDGIGIGLALSKLIIQDFAGSITWQNKQSGAGTEFVISLPLHTSK